MDLQPQSVTPQDNVPAMLVLLANNAIQPMKSYLAQMTALIQITELVTLGQENAIVCLDIHTVIT